MPDPFGQRGIAVPVLELRGDVQRAERLDLVLGRAVEDRVRAPQHVVLADVLQELPEHVRRLGRRSHEVPEGGTELRVDILVRTHARLAKRRDQPVDADRLRPLGVRPLGRPRLEPRVVDDELRVRVLLRRRTDVDR